MASDQEEREVVQPLPHDLVVTGHMRGPQVRYSTIYRFKGPEADAIIGCPLSEPTGHDAVALQHLRYVACSRAHFSLHVIERTVPVPGIQRDAGK